MTDFVDDIEKAKAVSDIAERGTLKISATYSMHIFVFVIAG